MRLVICFSIKIKYRLFWIQEYETLCSIFGVECKYLSDPDKFDCQECPFFEVDLPDYETAQKIASRSVMIKYILEPYSQGDSFDNLLDNLNKELFYSVLEDKNCIKFKVEAIDKKLKPEESNAIINRYGDYAPKHITFSMADPDIIFMVVANPKTNVYYFGPEVAWVAWKNNKSNFYAKYDLKARPYLGPTSTSHELAFLMANQAEIKEGDYVYDPFTGTGSILIACSALKALCFGSDIDLRVLQGYKVGRNTKKELKGTEIIKGNDKPMRDDVFHNFKYYGLPKPNILAMDISYPTILPGKFDAIVCDPPYGVKAGSK